MIIQRKVVETPILDSNTNILIQKEYIINDKVVGKNHIWIEVNTIIKIKNQQPIVLFSKDITLLNMIISNYFCQIHGIFIC